jgi:hypothetical protein
MLVSAKLKVYCVCGVYRDAVGASTDSWLSLARRGLVRARTPPSAAGAMELLGVATNSKPTHARIPLHPLGPRHTPTYTRIHTHAAMDNLGKISAFGKTFSYVRVTAKCRRRHRPQAARLAERETHRLTWRPQRFLHTLCRTHPAICQGAAGPGRRQDAAAPRLH